MITEKQVAEIEKGFTLIKDNVIKRKFIKKYTHFGNLYYEEERIIYKCKVENLDKSSIPKELKILKVEKHIWNGFNKNPNFDKDFPIFEELKQKAQEMIEELGCGENQNEVADCGDIFFHTECNRKGCGKPINCLLNCGEKIFCTKCQKLKERLEKIK